MDYSEHLSRNVSETQRKELLNLIDELSLEFIAYSNHLKAKISSNRFTQKDHNDMDEELREKKRFIKQSSISWLSK